LQCVVKGKGASIFPGTRTGIIPKRFEKKEPLLDGGRWGYEKKKSINCHMESSRGGRSHVSPRKERFPPCAEREFHLIREKMLASGGKGSWRLGHISIGNLKKGTNPIRQNRRFDSVPRIGRLRATKIKKKKRGGYMKKV